MPSSGSERWMLDYPFPLAGAVCTLTLPKDGLTREEADRLKDYIDTLVTREDEAHAAR